MHAPSTRSLRALISISALALTSAAPLVTSAAHADTPQAHARAHSHHRFHDRDHDGLPNGWEKRHGLNPNRANGKADADHDGLTNRQEYKKGLNPKAGDSDHDGLKDGREVKLGTNPRSADTDHDGLKDGREVQLGTSPKSADSDHDGLKDGDEVTKYKSDPTKSDSDGDGVKDGTEVTAGTDPTKPPTTTTPPGDGGGTTTPPGDGGGTTTPPGDGGGTGGTGGGGVVTPSLAITSPGTDAVTTARPTFKGTGKPGADITVNVTASTPVTVNQPSSGEVAGALSDISPVQTTPVLTLQTIVHDDGKWEVQGGPGDALNTGDYTATATQTTSGGASTTTDAVQFKVDADVPGVLTIDDSVSGPTNNARPLISGDGAEAGATVTVTEEDTALGNAEISADGHWVFTPSEDFTAGPHTLTVTQTDKAGNTSEAATVTFTVDTAAPQPPTIGQVSDIGVGGNTTPPINGSVAEDGDTVTVTLHRAGTTSDNDQSFTPAVTNGTWQVTPTALADGEYTVTATESDAAGNTSEASKTFTVDTQAPAAPSIASPEDDSTVTETTPTISGTGAGDRDLVVTLTGSDDTSIPLEPPTVEEGGAWSVTPSEPLADGTYTVTVSQTDAVGNASTESTSTFTVDAGQVIPGA
ncbi:Ig-like domain-containing protein [Nocardioides nematodiphilus]|uniref:Ig-like domain-containing protein n=1 Tax=Nocardioides nematodiphilus TaxID=2849669 RepID=UPI001CD9F513|nr:Ig-like domain-containing protein [Nocardioides nematodiphilus]MCA1984349.1 Ig-like domain-containing protein [Nocardioides nematodiphilus]